MFTYSSREGRPWVGGWGDGRGEGDKTGILQNRKVNLSVKYQNLNQNKIRFVFSNFSSFLPVYLLFKCRFVA